MKTRSIIMFFFPNYRMRRVQEEKERDSRIPQEILFSVDMKAAKKSTC